MKSIVASRPTAGRYAVDFELATRDLIIVAEHTAAHEADMAETDAIGYPRSRFVILIESCPFLVRSVGGGGARQVEGNRASSSRQLFEMRDHKPDGSGPEIRQNNLSRL